MVSLRWLLLDFWGGLSGVFPEGGPNGRFNDIYTTKNIIFLKTIKKGNEKKNSTQLQKIDERLIVTARVTS